MKKQILAIALGLVLLFTAGTAALAADDGGQWEVSYAGGKQLESDYAFSGLADKVFQMQPGDEIELTANLSNKDSAASNWYMTNKVIKTLEEAEHTVAGGAYTYRLTYQGPGDAEELELYNSQRVGGETTQGRALADGRIGLEQATEGLEDWLYLDTLGSGQAGVVRLRVALDGESQGNAYQDTLARLQLNFAVDPVTEYNRTETRTDNRTQQRELRIVRTGDVNEALPFIILAGVSGLLLLILGLMGLAEKKRLKKAAQKLTCLALAGFLALSMPAAFGLTAHAADAGAQDPNAPAGTTQSEDELRSYQVRIFPGLQTAAAQGATITVVQSDDGNGTNGKTLVPRQLIDGEIKLDEVPGGSFLTITIDDPADGSGTKYYLRGVRESGEDNSTLSAAAFQVDRDVDYVIAYGIKGQRVRYVLRFVDANGNRLMEDREYWGNVGDKPIVACQYIEGYRPNALNLTKTLVAEDDIKENVFEFVYTPLGTNVTTEFIDGGVTFVDGGVTVIEGGGGGGGAAPGPGGPAAPAGPGGEELPEPETPLGPPEEIVDLDEQKTPLAGLIDDFATNLSGLSAPVKVALIGGAIALGTLLILAIFKKRKEQDAAESEG